MALWPSPPPSRALLQGFLAGMSGPSGPRTSTGSIDVGWSFDEEEQKAAAAKKQKELEEAEDPSIEQTRKRRFLMCLFVVFLVIPAVVLSIRGFMDRDECGDLLDQCQSKCREVYADDSRFFQSQFEGERGCIANCQSEEDVCLTKATAIISMSIMLLAGLLCAVCLLFTLDALMNRLGGGGGDTDMDHADLKPRSAYIEPMFTEDEIRKQPVPFWRKYLQRKKKKVKTIEVKCSACDVDVTVDVRWMTGDRAGTDGARCPRCRKIIVGVA